mmetsp:Transcript_40216/g.106179  ORF Transcript_40216/g.106179 Transcript_40216/m.106179 type:complete len:212 (+) Transcript_40216:479-1114(+)
MHATSQRVEVKEKHYWHKLGIGSSSGLEESHSNGVAVGGGQVTRVAVHTALHEELHIASREPSPAQRNIIRWHRTIDLCCFEPVQPPGLAGMLICLYHRDEVEFVRSPMSLIETQVGGFEVVCSLVLFLKNSTVRDQKRHLQTSVILEGPYRARSRRNLPLTVPVGDEVGIQGTAVASARHHQRALLILTQNMLNALVEGHASHIVIACPC